MKRSKEEVEAGAEILAAAQALIELARPTPRERSGFDSAPRVERRAVPREPNEARPQQRGVGWD